MHASAAVIWAPHIAYNSSMVDYIQFWKNNAFPHPRGLDGNINALKLPPFFEGSSDLYQKFDFCVFEQCSSFIIQSCKRL